MSGEKLRLRFAPSPTGPLHVGGLRTALYNYFLARKRAGQFVLRIEDTDRARRVKGAEDYIARALEWIGIVVDEGPQEGGAYGPYRQSERLIFYQKHIKTLLQNGWAYPAFDTPEELQAMREQLQKEGAVHQHYGHSTRLRMKNTLSLPPRVVEEKMAKEPYVIRLEGAPRRENICTR